MKKIALFCVICLLLTALPCAVSAGSGVTVTVSDVAGDIVTVSGNATIDSVVTVIILNPGKEAADIVTSDIDDVQYMKSALSKAGSFSFNIKMNTGTLPNKKEGAFTVFVSVDGKLVYSDSNFIFYSNETKMSYVNDLKVCTEDQLLAIEEGSLTKVEKIFETYSLSNHELYKDAKKEDLVKVICAQTARKALSTPADAGAFLTKVLVHNAFDKSNSKLVTDNNFKYTEVWADNNGSIDMLYTDNFVNDLRTSGKSAVIKATLGADYSDKQFEDVFKTFKEAMLLNLILNNVSMGSGHIEGYILSELKAEYEAAGFNTNLLSSITDAEEKTAKLDDFLVCGATTLQALAAKFNEIMAKTITNDDDTNTGNGNTSLPSVSAPSGGGGGGFGGGTPSPTPTVTPTPSASPQPTAPVSACPFTDLSGVAWAVEAVEYLYENKIISGRTETEFAGNATVTRAELVKMITEALDVAENAENIIFTDVNDTDWFAPYVKHAASAGIIIGDGGAFRPNGEVTREDAALIIYRALGLEKGESITFTDAESVSDYAKEAVAAMVRDGLISGMGDGTFAPKATLTRAQAAQIIYNAITKGGAAQ